MFIGPSFLTDCECFCRETKHVPFICMLTLQTGPKGSVCFFYKSMGAFYLSFIYQKPYDKTGKGICTDDYIPIPDI